MPMYDVDFRENRFFIQIVLKMSQSTFIKLEMRCVKYDFPLAAVHPASKRSMMEEWCEYMAQYDSACPLSVEQVSEINQQELLINESAI